jgi:hypothetical protein
MSESKPTPTPWSWDYNEISGPFDGKTMETVVGQEPGSNYESYGPLILSAANGQFIVRAVNSHEALVGALKAALYELHCGPSNDGREPSQMNPGEFASGHWCPQCDEGVDRNGEARELGRSALELAGEKL